MSRIAVSTQNDVIRFPRNILAFQEIVDFGIGNAKGIFVRLQVRKRFQIGGRHLHDQRIGCANGLSQCAYAPRVQTCKPKERLYRKEGGSKVRSWWVQEE